MLAARGGRAERPHAAVGSVQLQQSEEELTSGPPVAHCVWGGGEQLQHLHHQTCQTVSQMTVSRASTEFTDECTLDQTWPRHAQQARACCLAPTAPWSEMALLRRAVGPGGSLARLRLRLLSSYGVYSATAPGAPAAPTAAAAAAAGAANATGGSSSRRGGRKPDAGARGVGLGSLVLLAPCVGTAALGAWQLQRRQDKAAQLALREERLAAPPLPLAEAVAQAAASSDAGAQLEHRRIACEGALDVRSALFVGPRTVPRAFGAAERGYHMVVPLIPAQAAEGGALEPPVLLNFGWVPLDWKERGVPEDARRRMEAMGAAAVGAQEQTGDGEGQGPRAAAGSRWRLPFGLGSARGGSSSTGGRAAGQAGRVARVVGVARGSEMPSGFVPPNDPAAGQWFSFDAPAMAQAAGLPPGTPFLDVLDRAPLAEGGDAMPGREGGRRPALAALDPRAVSTARLPPMAKRQDEFLRFPVMPDGHLGYALTWLALSAATSAMAFARLRAHIMPRVVR